MKNVKRFTAIALLFAMILTGCGESNNASSKNPASSGSNAAGTDNSLQYILDNGELILGLDASFPPMGYTDDDQNIVGFDIDVAKEVCKRMDIKLKLKSIDWDSKELELDTKNIDCIWNGLSYSKDRDEAMTLSEPYMTNRQVIVTLADSDIKSEADLKGKVVALQSGSTASEALDKKAELKDSLKDEILIDDNVKAMMDLKINGSDAVIMDEVVARYYTEKEPDTYKVLDDSMADEQYVIGFRKGENLLCQEVEKCLKAMKADGTLESISKTWFGEDLTTIK